MICGERACNPDVTVWFLRDVDLSSTGHGVLELEVRRVSCKSAVENFTKYARRLAPQL